MSKIEVIVPSLGESISQVTLERIIAKEGSYVDQDDSLVELGSEKASVEVPSPASGTVSYVAKAGDTLKVGAVIGHIDTTAKKVEKEKPAAAPAPAPTPKAAPRVESSESIRISPEEHIASLTEQKSSKAEPKTPAKPLEAQRREPMSRLRKTIARRLVQVKNETAMLTTFNEVDMSAIMGIRDREKESFLKKYSAKLTFMPFFVKASVSALKAFPEVNAYIDGEDIVYNKGIHISIAVSTPTGLVVPILRDTDQMKFSEIAQNLTELAIKARDKKLSVADMTGGTFTITNGGVFGSMLSTPILNPPQSAILGMHNIVDRAVVVNGKIEVRPIMYLALSYDHRIIDGKDSVTFLVHIKNMLEDPARFLLDD